MNSISRFTSAITSGPIPSPGSSKSLWVAIGVVLKRNAGRSLKRWTQDLQAAHALTRRAIAARPAAHTKTVVRQRHGRQGGLFAGRGAGDDPTWPVSTSRSLAGLWLPRPPEGGRRHGASSERAVSTLGRRRGTKGLVVLDARA